MSGVEQRTCPFCAAKVVLREFDERFPDKPFGLVGDHQKQCFLSMQRDEVAVVTAWNTRATDTELADLRSKLDVAREAQKQL